MKLVIIDNSEVVFNGNTLNVRGLGGSESAIILLSKELSKIGFEVTVINNCKSDTCISGIFDNITYIDKSDINSITDKFEIVISSRSVIPFISKDYSFITNSYKVVWLHDTFCEGDHLLETLLIDNIIDEIFTLSDFHTNYILNANHGSPRMFEVLKNKVFQTRNGAVKYKTNLANDKSKNKFVFNSAVSKGLIPLLNDIWPKVFEKIPTARLTVIGGYYLLKDNKLDDQGKLVKDLHKNRDYDKYNIQFQDIMPPHEVANFISQSGFMIYPAAYPETFGISSLESLLYKTPIITCRFGALEETAIEKSCYLLNYPIEPNSLFPNINKEDQINKFVDLVVNAYNDDYLYNQKQEYCSIIEDVYGWNTIALQWKQHLYYKLGYFLSKEDYHKVVKINNDVARIFSRRNKNLVELAQYPNYNNSEKHISIITPVYNSEQYISRCIESVITQDYSNYTLYIIDDNSSDKTKEIINYFLPNDKIILIENIENKGALYNQVNTIKEYCSDDDIVILLDGDDCLTNNNSLFNFYNELHDNYDFSYGSCWSEIDNIPLIAQEYPLEIIKTKQYRNHLFAWNIPYTHLRTFKKFLLNDIDEESFKNNGDWIKAGGDVALFYELIYQVEGNRIKAVKDIMAYYNDKNSLNDYKINSEEQTNNVKNILSKKDPIPFVKDVEAKISVIIPTMWKYKPFCKFLEKLVAAELVEEIIIINNDVNNTPEEDILKHEKIKLHNFDENIFVNPAWNYGVSQALNNKLAIINDDIEYDIRVFEKVYPYIIPENGAIGILYNNHTNTDITIKSIEEDLFGLGSLFFIHKNNWINIPNELKIYCGDNFVFDVNRIKGKQNFSITDIEFYTPMATTTNYLLSGEIICPGINEEADFYHNLINNFEYKNRKPKHKGDIYNKLDDKLEIFYHVFVPDHVNISSLWWIDEQLSAIEISDLKSYANINICITIDKNSINPLPEKKVLESIIDHINAKYSYVNILDIRDISEENIYEQQTLNFVYDFSINNPNKKVLYIHTKGISVFSESQKEWLDILNKTLINDWKKCIEQLEDNDVVGLNDLSLINKPILSGNFWWANTNYIANLPNPKNTHIYNNNNNNRYAYELWITFNKPKVALVYNDEKKYNKILKTVLIAIPTDKYISPETFKSIYDLVIPIGYKIEFQYFYGYRIDQVRNLIADWGKNYDYLFAVDSDIVLPSDTLRKLLYADKDVVSGLYIQRIENTHNLELFSDNRIPYEDIKGKGLIEVKGCGFGCVLIKSEIFRTMEYPHFLYTHALDHNDTYSEDTYFCDKARSLGYKIYADTTIKCGHIGETTFVVE